MKRSYTAVYAEEMMRLQDEVSLAAPLSQCTRTFSVPEAYTIAGEVLRRREAGGWRRVGRKIGFTNRTIWDQYQVYEPMFGYMYDRTVAWSPGSGTLHEPAGAGTQTYEAVLDLSGLVQPLIEPEIVFGLREPPPLTDDPEELLGAVEWVGHGFEIVQCHFPDWRFTIADTIADGGLHGCYAVGPRLAVTPGNRGALVEQLASFRLSLLNNGDVAAEGGGALVLDSPLNALAYLLRTLHSLPDHPPLEAGELITTGTLTAALPVAPGETWSTRIEGLPLPGMTLRFASAEGTGHSA